MNQRLSQTPLLFDLDGGRHRVTPAASMSPTFLVPGHIHGSFTARRTRVRKEGEAESFPLVCASCGKSAEAIALFTRVLPSGRSTLEMPVLTCLTCHEAEKMNPSNRCWSPYAQRPLGSRLCLMTFEKLRRMERKELVRLWSLRRYEVNFFRRSRWQKTLWRIWYLGQTTEQAR